MIPIKKSVNLVLLFIRSFTRFELIFGQGGLTNGYTYDGSSLSVIIYIRQPISTSELIKIQVELSESITHSLLVHTPTSIEIFYLLNQNVIYNFSINILFPTDIERHLLYK